jgi:two-component system sensor histidine kinase UhpB
MTPDSLRRLKRSVFLHYGVAVLSVATALFIALWLQAQYNFEPFVAFLCAMMFSAWFGGVKPGLLAVALSLLAFHYYFLIPIYPLGMQKEMPRLLFAALTSLFVVLLSAAQRSATESLRESELRSRLAIDTIPTMAWTLRPEGVVDFLNQRWLDYAGLTLEQYVKDPMGPMHPEDIPRVMEKWRADMAVGAPYEDEMRLRRADGVYRWFLVRTAPLRDAQGNIVKWYGVSIDIEDRKEAEQILRDSGEQLRALTARLQSLREEERSRISREIHDELGQRLTGLKMDLLRAERKLEGLDGSPAVNSLLDTIVSVTELADGIAASVQEIAANLRPGVLDKLGLGAALHCESRRFQERAGVLCEAHLPETDLNLSTEVSTALFRIFQECLTNIARHGHATKVEAELKQEGAWVNLRVQDNGRGITEAELADPQSLGLLGMKERTALLGGEIVFKRNPGGGTIVTARVPQSGTAFQAKEPVKFARLSLMTTE